jgi:hypothetical protein
VKSGIILGESYQNQLAPPFNSIRRSLWEAKNRPEKKKEKRRKRKKLPTRSHNVLGQIRQAAPALDQPG